ncbi:MAG: DUF4404 family protein [Gammaproteobacteria bacterium]|jgi:hypothetical protein|nr:DUF4404 family protein [Gammaproteobacteria bacterium]
MELSKLQAIVGSLKTRVNQQISFDKTEADAIRAEVAELSALLASTDDAHDEPINDQLTRMAAEFEADHPQASRLLERIADTLSKLGI